MSSLMTPIDGQDHDVDGGVRVEPEQVLEEDGVAAAGGVEEAEVEDPLEGHQQDGDRHHRGAEDLDDRGGVVGPHEQRHPEPRHPRGPHLVDGDDEVEPGEDRGEPGHEDADRGDLHVALREHGRVGRVEGPAGLEPAREERVERDAAPEHVEVPAQQVELREGEVLRPDHEGDEEVPEHGRDRRDQEEEHHDHAVGGEGLVVGVRGHVGAVRDEEVPADEARVEPAQDEHRGDREEVQDPDPLVVLRQQPGLEVPPAAQEVVLRVRRLGAHRVASVGTCSDWM